MYHSRLSFSSISSLKRQRNKLNTNKSKKLAFLSQQFHCNKKTSCSVSGGGGSVSVIISTDIGVDNAADSNITELLHATSYQWPHSVKTCCMRLGHWLSSW